MKRSDRHKARKSKQREKRIAMAKRRYQEFLSGDDTLYLVLCDLSEQDSTHILTSKEY